MSPASRNRSAPYCPSRSSPNHVTLAALDPAKRAVWFGQWGTAMDAASAVTRYLDTYLAPPNVQDAEEAESDPQLGSIITTLLDKIAQRGESGSIVDVGCGTGILLQRLLLWPTFRTLDGWLYVGIDREENLDLVQKIARKKQMGRRVKLINIDDFYKEWPCAINNPIVFCRNVLHELTIKNTATFLNHLSVNLSINDCLIVQDLMNFSEGERHNPCWHPDEFAVCVRGHGFAHVSTTPLMARSGARWFNLIAGNFAPPQPPLSLEDSEACVRDGRQRQWDVWAAIESTTAGNQRHPVVAAIDLDLQFASLTRQLRDSGAILSVDHNFERRMRSRALAGAIHSFVEAGQLERTTVAETVRLRERGEQLNRLEEFLRSETRLAVVRGGGGSGKTTLVVHLLAARAYEKVPVIIDARRGTDLWSFVEQLFSQVGLRLRADILSILSTLTWTNVEPRLRAFANRFASQLIVFVDNFDALLDSNGAIENEDVAQVLSVLVGVQGAKLIIAQRTFLVSPRLQEEAQVRQLPLVELGRYATDQTVVNVLDDYFNRAAAGLPDYPPRLLRAIDRYPLAAMLAGEILHKAGKRVLLDDRFFLELEQRMRHDLWKRLVDRESMDAVLVASELRVAVPRRMMLEKLVPSSSVESALGSGALYMVNDMRWPESLVALMAVFCRRHVEGDFAQTETNRQENAVSCNHSLISELYFSIYKQHDDDPKWIRESYFHRMLSGDADAVNTLGHYYLKELVASADYCFLKKHDYSAALHLYNAAINMGEKGEDVQMHRASSLIRVGQRKDGDVEFDRLVEHYPKNVGIRTSFVDALLFVRDYGKAIEKLKELNLDPENNDWIAGQWGRAWVGLNQYAKAKQMFRKQISLKSLPDAESYLSVARCLQYQGAVEDAIKILKSAKEKFFPRDDRFSIAIGANLERLREDQSALDMLVPIFNARPDYTSAVSPIVKIVARRGDIAEARRYYERAKKKAYSLSDQRLLFMEIEILKGEGRADDALMLLRRQPQGDVHVFGMMEECWYHHARDEIDPTRRREIARQALAEPLPENFSSNMPVVINRARLAALAGDRNMFDNLLEKVLYSRTAGFEAENLQELWGHHNPG